MVEIFRNGGAWAYLIVLLTIAGVLVTIGLAVARAVWRPVPGVLWVGVPVLIGVAALVGVEAGLLEMETALATAPPEYRAQLSAQGLSIALTLPLLAGGGLGVVGVVASFGLGLSGLIAARKAPRSYVAPVCVGVAALLAFVAAVGSVLITGHSYWPTAFPGIATALCLCALVPLCLARPDDPAQAVANLNDRVALAGLAVVACVGVATAVYATETVQVFAALASATPDTRQALLGRGLELAGGSFRAGLLAGLAALAGGAAALAGSRGWGTRAVVGVAATILCVVVAVGAQSYAGVWRVAGSVQSLAVGFGATSDWVHAPKIGTGERPSLAGAPDVGREALHLRAQ
jgi:hypothetical protein